MIMRLGTSHSDPHKALEKACGKWSSVYFGEIMFRKSMHTFFLIPCIFLNFWRPLIFRNNCIPLCSSGFSVSLRLWFKHAMECLEGMPTEILSNHPLPQGMEFSVCMYMHIWVSPCACVSESVCVYVLQGCSPWVTGVSQFSWSFGVCLGTF